MTGAFELIVILAVIGFIINNSRAHMMVDVIRTRFHDVYVGWENKTYKLNNNVRERPVAELNLAGRVHPARAAFQRKRAIQKDVTQTSRDNLLFKLKESSWDVVNDGKSRPFMGSCCSKCSVEGISSVDEATKKLNVRNILLLDKASTGGNFFLKLFSHLYQTWKVRKFQYPLIYETVLADGKLKEAINMTAQEQLKQRPVDGNPEVALRKLVKQHEARARRILNDMRSKLSDLLLRVTSWILLKVLPRFLDSVVVHPAQVEMLQKASKTGLPVIFLPLHRSHLDYILISFILLNIDVKSPMVAAGDNLRIPVFGSLLRSLGAFFIKRRIDPVSGRRDTVYRAVLHTYMMQCLRAGHNIEFFVEGGRTRTGKPCMPKGGLLSVIVDAYMDGLVEDAILVPVSLNYDKLVDGNFTKEQLGIPKQMETFSSAIRGIWTALTKNYGLIRIDFNQPFSLKDMVSSFQLGSRGSKALLPVELLENGDPPPAPNPRKRDMHSAPSSSSLYGTDVVVEEHRQLVESIARHILYDCTRSTAIMSTNILSFLLLTSYREGAPVEQLVRAMDKLREELELAGRDCGFTGDSQDVINHAVRILGADLVRQENHVDASGQEVTYIKPSVSLPYAIELHYYSNSLLTHYVMDSAAASALVSLVSSANVDVPSSNRPSDPIVYHDDLVKGTLSLCEILQFEFIFVKGCQSLESAILDAIDNLKYHEIISEQLGVYTEDEKWCRRFASNFDDDDDDEDYEREDRVIRDSERTKYHVNTRNTISRLEFYHCPLRPLIEVYTVTAMCLKRLIGEEMAEADFTSHVLNEMQAHYKRGFVSYPESISLDGIKNALKLFERWGILECHQQDRLKLYYLSNNYDGSERLQPVIDNIRRFKFTVNHISSAKEASQ